MKKVPVLAYVFALLCLLAVQCFGQNGAPVVAMSSPGGNGSGSSIHFHVTAADPNGVADIGWLGIGVGMGWQYSGGCFILVYPNADKNYIVLLNDASTVWNGPFGIGGQWVAENSQCSINMATFSRTVSTQSNGSLTADFDVNFKSSFVGQRYIYTIASDLAGWYGGGNPTAGWYVTLPTGGPSYDRASFTAFAESDGPRLGVDTMTNQPMYLEDAMHPLPTINLDTATGDNPAVVMAGSLGTVSIRNAKPNTQVWARGYVFDPISHTSNGDPESDLYYLPNPQATIYSSVTWPSGDTSFPGGWLVGTTDPTGKFDLSFQAGASFGDNAIAMYVGNETVSSQTGLDGVTRQNYNASLNPANYFGSVTFFITDNSQSNLPSPFYALEKGKAPSVRTWSQKLIDSCRKAHPVSEFDHMACIQKGLEDPQLDQE